MAKPFEKGFQQEHVEYVKKQPPLPPDRKPGCIKIVIIILVIIILIIGYMYMQGK